MGKNSKKQFRPNEKTYRGHQNLDKFLSDKKLQRKQIAKDGSCLFRAVAEQVFSSQSCHQKVRMQCVEYIQAHQDDFKGFITTSMPEYLEQLKNELWGGELELVVLSRLYERSIIIYNEANGLVHEQVFQASEDQASSSSQQHKPIMLAFLGGNHYDSVYSTQHMRNTAFCQGVVYEMLFLRVLKDTMPPLCKQRLTTLQDSDVEQIRKHQEAAYSYDRPFIERPVHLLSTHYKLEEIESMASNIYRNTALDVHQREKANIERRDRHVAASIQFQRGDAIIFKIGDKEMEGEIANLNVSPGCHLVYMHKSGGETWEIPAKDITLKQSHLNSGRRSSSGQYRSRNQQQQLYGGQMSGQKGQQQQLPADSSGKATDTPTMTKEAPSSKKSGAQGGKSKDGKKGGSAAQQGSQNPSSKGVPAGAEKIATQPHTLGSAPPPRTPTSEQKQTAGSSNSISLSGGTNVEPSNAGQRRAAPSLSKNIQHTQVRGGHNIKATSHPPKVNKRTDAGSLDSDDPSSTSDDESSPHSDHPHPHSRRRPHHTQGSRTNNTTDSLPAYYDEDDWSMGEQETETRVALQKQERKTIPMVEGKLHIGRGGLGYSDASIKQQQMRATQKTVSGQTMKSDSGETTTKVGEVKVATSSRSSDPSKLGVRQTGTTAPVTKQGESTRTSPGGKQQSQQQQSSQQSKVMMQVPAPAGLLQQQSPIQGLIDGPNSERDGRESPPYLERMIPRDPSSQPQDAWPLFEEDAANLPPPIAAMMVSVTSRQQQQQQHQAPTSPPAGSGVVLHPPPASTIATTHNINPPLPEPGTGIIPIVPPLAHAPAQQQPTPPQSPISDQLQTGGAGQLPTLPQNIPMYPPPVPVSPPSSSTAAIPTMFQPLMQPGHFIPPMTTAAAVQQFFAVSGGGGAGIPTGPDMLYNQAHYPHSNTVPAPPPELANGSSNSGGDDSSSSVAGMTSLISPLQPLSIKKPSPRGERTATAAMSPLTVTAYTQTSSPKLTSTLTQTDVKGFREEGTQFEPRTVRKVGAQTDGQFVAVSELSPPELEDDSKVAKVNFAIEYSIQCLNMYLQYMDDDETSSELLQMLENLKEQRLQEQAMPYESQLTALNASQQDFLVSLARDTAPQFPINAHPVREGPTGVNIYQPKPMKEATPPPLAGEDVTLQQAAASLPGIVKQPPPDSSSTSDLLPSAQDDDKSGDVNNELTPQQEVQPPTVVPPYPLPPHLMMHPQRYMMPMPMFYGPGFYPHSFPSSMPGLPGMPGMMMPPYGHHMMPPVPQQQQPPPPATGQPEQSLESLEDTSSTTTSISTTKLSPPLLPTTIIPNQPPPPISVSSASIELESSSSTSIDHQSVPMVDGVQALHVTAFQAEDVVPEDSQSLPLLSINATLENRGEGEVLQPTSSISTMLEDQHQQVQQEDDGQQLGSTAFIPSTTAAAVEQQVGDYQIQSEEKMPPTVEIDVNISNPGLPCRGSSESAKEKEVVSSEAVEDKESDQKADTKQQKPKSSRTKQQQQQTQQENTTSKQLSRASSTTYPRQQQQQNYQRMGGTGTYNNSSKQTMYNNRSRYMYNNYGNQRQQQYNNPNRRFNNYQSNSGRYTRYTPGGNGGNSGRYQQWNPYKSGYQQHGGVSSYSSSSEQGANRPHNPSRSKVHTSNSSSSDHSSKSVTPVPATNANPSSEDHDRNVPQFNNSNNNYLSSGPKSFTSFPSSPQNHHSSINGEMAMNSSMIVPQTATDSAPPMTASRKGEKKVHRWHFKETESDRHRLEVPDPNLWNWTSGGDRQLGSRQPGDYADTVEDPFPTMTVGGGDKEEFAFKDACMDDFDAKQMEELFPALKSDIRGRYDTAGIHHPPAQCTNGSDAQMRMLAGSGGVHNFNNN